MFAGGGVIDIFAIAVWPLMAVGVWLGIKAKGAEGGDPRLSWAFFIGALAFFLVPLIVMLSLFSHYSALIIADQYCAMMVAGAFLLFSFPRKGETTWKNVFSLAIGIALLAGSSWYLVGDFLVRRQSVEGTILDLRKKRVVSARRSRIHYNIDFSKRTYETTFDIYRTVKKGQRIRAEIGQASGLILAVAPLPIGAHPQ